MKLKTIEVKIVELEPQETKLLIELLNYCYHRAVKHDSPVSKFAEQIEIMRKDLKIIK